MIAMKIFQPGSDKENVIKVCSKFFNQSVLENFSSRSDEKNSIKVCLIIFNQSVLEEF